MAGQAQRGPRDHRRSSHHGSPLALVAAASTGGPGSEVATATPSPEQALGSAKAPTPTPRAVWRLLQMEGMTPDEAASLTAFLYGLPTGDGRFGGHDGGRKLTH